MTDSYTSCISKLYQIVEADLSINQKEIAILYAMGNTIDEIATRKSLKDRTVRNHLDIIRLKMGAVTLSDIRTVILLRILSTLCFKK